MRAAVLHGPDDLRIEIVHPPQPGPYEALCLLLYGAVCSGTDQHLVAGHFPWMPTLPAILGHESVGRVVAVGDRVRHLRLGDLVTRVGAPPSPHGAYGSAWGGFCEQGIAVDHQAMREDGLDAARWRPAQVQRVLPAGSDPAAATLFITWRETLSYFNRRQITPGQRVLVVGSGGNALAFIAHARHAGAQVTAIGSAARAATATAVGATQVLDHRGAEVYAAAAQHGPFDLVIDTLGRHAVRAAALPLIRPGGCMAVYGIDEPCDADFPTVIGGVRCVGHNDYDEAEAHAAVLERYRSRALDAGYWLDGPVLPLEALHEALVMVRDRRAIKPLIRLSHDSWKPTP